MSKKRVWRPLNTWGIYLLGTTTGFVLVYSILELSRVCSSV
jgi:hypothetical protein